jgi:branched-chain amino acid transport system permease protein
MELLGQAVAASLGQGPLLALIAVGFVVIYRSTQVVSFAQSGFLVIGGLLFAALANAGWSLIASIVASAVATGIVGALVFRVLLARLVGSSPLVPAVATIGIAGALLAVCSLAHGDQTITLDQQYFDYKMKDFLGIHYTSVQIFALIVGLVLFCLVVALLFATPLGLRMRAVAEGPRLAAYVGIPTIAISALAWGIGAASASVAASVYTVGNQPAPSDLYNLGLGAFPAILLGGFDSIPGALIGGLLVAFVQSFVVLKFGGQYQDLVAYSCLLIVLLLRPQGILGSKEVVRL